MFHACPLIERAFKNTKKYESICDEFICKYLSESSLDDFSDCINMDCSRFYFYHNDKSKIQAQRTRILISNSKIGLIKKTVSRFLKSIH